VVLVVVVGLGQGQRLSRQAGGGAGGASLETLYNSTVEDCADLLPCNSSAYDNYWVYSPWVCSNAAGACQGGAACPLPAPGAAPAACLPAKSAACPFPARVAWRG
jgi:hypothetical protein